MWEAMLVILCIALWQWSQLKGKSPPSRWAILVDKGCLALPSELSVMDGSVIHGRISVWLTEEEFVFVEGSQMRKMDVIDATVLGTLKRDAISELFLLFGNEATRAAMELGFSGDELKFHCLTPSKILILLIRGEMVDGMSMSHAFCMDRSAASIPVHEHVIRFFQWHTLAPIRKTISGP